MKDRLTDVTLLERGSKNRLYCLLIDVQKKNLEVLTLSKGTKELWHRHLGHLNAAAFNILNVAVVNAT